MLEKDIEIIIRSMCQDLYESLRHDNSAFSKLKSLKYLSKIKKFNTSTECKYSEEIRDKIGILYKNYMVFSKKEEYENNSDVISEIKKFYVELCNNVEQRILGSSEQITYAQHKKIENYIKELESTYGGQTEKYIKKLSNKKIGPQKHDIMRIYKDKTKITATKKSEVISILKNKLYNGNNNSVINQDINIIYNSNKAEYLFIKIENGNIVQKKKYKFNTNFSDLEELQKRAMKNLKKLNFSMSLYDEIKVDKDSLKYLDPFIVNIFAEEGYLDYAKIYLKEINGDTDLRTDKLPFKIIYQLDDNFKHGILSPTRNHSWFRDMSAHFRLRSLFSCCKYLLHLSNKAYTIIIPFLKYYVNLLIHTSISSKLMLPLYWMGFLFSLFSYA